MAQPASSQSPARAGLRVGAGTGPRPSCPCGMGGPSADARDPTAWPTTRSEGPMLAQKGGMHARKSLALSCATERSSAEKGPLAGERGALPRGA